MKTGVHDGYWSVLFKFCIQPRYAGIMFLLPFVFVSIDLKKSLMRLAVILVHTWVFGIISPGTSVQSSLNWMRPAQEKVLMGFPSVL